MNKLKKMALGAAFHISQLREGGLLYRFAPGHGRCLGYKLNERSEKRVMVFAVAEKAVENGMTGLLDEDTLNVFGIVVDTPGAAESIAKAFTMMAEEMRKSCDAAI